ncbi:hypothetical protein [Streptomyces puniciscabiei]|uniref:hypothetical protein n=1 Tax=Streptomyces puniciscabiei TaxID=164348 RepID=UPI0037BD288B
MGWAKARERVREILGDLAAAIPVNAARLPAAGLLWWRSALACAALFALALGGGLAASATA